MRSKLFVPAARPDFFSKALRGDADALSFDLEDAIPVEGKDAARAQLADFLASDAARTSRKTFIVRVNAPDGPHFATDIAILAPLGPTLINVPKIDDAAALAAAAETLIVATASHNTETPRLLVNIETPGAVARAASIAAAHPLVAGLQVGLNDLFLILIVFDTVLTFPKDQVLMQRALSTTSAKQASRSVWVFAAILLPAGFLFYIIGTMLFAYYRANPGRLDPLLPVDAVFPAFIGTELPHGVTGVIIAGLIAAAMGTLSGTINSVATLLSVDFYEKLRRTPPTQKQSVRFAEWMTVLTGVVGVGIAVILSRLDVRSLLDLTIELFGLLGGSCAGAYALGMFSTRANWQGTAIGIVAAALITLVAWIFGLVHPYFYLAIAIVASIVIGYLASLLFPPPGPEQIEGMTVYTGGGRKGRPDIEPERVASTSTS